MVDQTLVCRIFHFFYTHWFFPFHNSPQSKIEKNQESQAAENMAESVADRLQQSLQYSLSATQSLAMIIDKDGIPHNFDSIAAYILKNNKYIDAVELVPDGVISYISPVKGNEAALGKNIFEDSVRSKEAFKAIAKKELYFAGPFELHQGGIGTVGRLPVFRNNKFWGFSAVVLRLPTFLRAAGIDTSGRNGYYFQLSKINPNTGNEEFFLPSRKYSPGEYKIAVPLPNGEWKLSVIPVNGYKSIQAILPISILAFILSVLGGIFAAYAARTPLRLQRLVYERTSELEESIDEAKKTEQELIKSRGELRELSIYLENIREEERLNVSREIHDHLGQQLAVLKMDVARLEDKTTHSKEAWSSKISNLLVAIDNMIEDVRKISLALRPGLLDDIGLAAAIEWYCHDFNKRTGIRTSFVSDVIDDSIPQQFNIGIFRIFQESLASVAGHSGALNVDVSLKCKDSQLLLLIADNGKGFDSSETSANTSQGILVMKERAVMMSGKYTINSVPGQGTIIEVSVPLAT